ncbi:hypothetical protein A8C32_03045 [Flavivirga aquatica]|uniref:Uncharacterized protein n=1 Tax=Flavivirga aquatica TaxID=1849968 RepID=A0A1E5TAM5_9FLAO|nr:hypothetical protein [Flavivirga aquatica]OEK08440.1 hypothetical protein A8C32_03045 [Flavivirga aquatica]
MKKLVILFCLFFIISLNYTPLFAQESAELTDDIPTNYKKRNPIYDYSEYQLNNTDTIPDFEEKVEKIKISGTIFKSDGVTPASNVILYINQPDENGNYKLKRKNRKRYIYHRGWIKTNLDGKYTFYTFVPGKFIRGKDLKHIHAAIKEPGKPEYDINGFLFDDDPVLTEACRLRLKKEGINNILKPVKKDNIYIATRDIILDKKALIY